MGNRCRKVDECMKKDFIVRRSITMVEGKPHVETYSEQELVRCTDCDLNIGTPHNPMCKTDGNAHDPDWFCADGKQKEDLCPD